MQSRNQNGASEGDDSVRLDVWLHATRFFKTRAVAAKAIKGGKVLWHGQRAKASRGIRVGDRLEVTRGDETFDLEVRVLLAKRVSASLAADAFEETAESRERREDQAARRKMAFHSAPRPQSRPGKRDRRRLIRFVREQPIEGSEGPEK
ncbi:MAG: S4 domain-containing protein [Pseudomonadota bacterium]